MDVIIVCSPHAANIVVRSYGENRGGEGERACGKETRSSRRTRTEGNAMFAVLTKSRKDGKKSWRVELYRLWLQENHGSRLTGWAGFVIPLILWPSNHRRSPNPWLHFIESAHHFSGKQMCTLHFLKSFRQMEVGSGRPIRKNCLSAAANINR